MRENKTQVVCKLAEFCFVGFLPGNHHCDFQLSLCIRKLMALNLHLWKLLCSLHRDEQLLFPQLCITVEEANGHIQR